MPDLFYGQWSSYDGQNPRLASPISATDTTIVVSDALLDEDGNAVTGSFLMGIKDKNGYTESVWVPAASSTDGITFTSCVRGIDRSGLDYTTQNDSTNAVAHDQDDPVFCQISGVNFEMMLAALKGDIASGGENWQIGNEANNDITVYAANGDVNKPFWRYVAADNKWVFSNDGVSSTPFGTGAGVTGGDGITVTAGDIDVDLTDTTVFRDSRNGNEARGVVTSAADGLIALNFLTANLNEADTFFGATDITGAEAEQLTDGSDATTKHYHGLTTERLQFQDREFISPFGMTRVSGGAGGYSTGPYLGIASQAANNSRGYLEWLIVTNGGAYSDLSGKNPEFCITGWFEENTAQDAFIGFVNRTFTGTSVEDGVMTLDHFGFIVADATLYISCADGTTQTKTDISSGITLNDTIHEYRATFDGTTATFYVDNVSKGTITTNVPNSNMEKFSFSIISDATAAAKTAYVITRGGIEIDKTITPY